MPLLPLLRKSPFARLLIFYAAGISAPCVSDNHHEFLYKMAGFLLVLWTIMLVIIVVSHNYHTGWISGGVAALILFLCGIWAMEIEYRKEKETGSIPVSTGIYRIRILDLPEKRNHSIRTTACVYASRSGTTWIKQHFVILVYLQNNSNTLLTEPGTELQIQAALKPIPGPGNPCEFDYKGYLASRHIYRQALVQQGCWIKIETSPRKSIRVMAALMRKRLLQSFENLDLDPKDYGLVTALTLGYKDDLDARTKQVFSRAGVMHIMALSGFNVGIIALVLGFILGIFDFGHAAKIGKTMTVILFLWLFAVVTGLSPSVTRATVMISFVLTGKLLHRTVNTFNVLFASAFVLLAASPGMLHDVSFQLSFAAVTGIILYQPILFNLILFTNKLLNKIWQLFTLTCSAQLATLPITLYYFHQFPVYFWLTNLYVVPLVSLIVCVGGIYLAFAFITPLTVYFGKILALLLKGLFISVSMVENLPCSLIHGVYISGIQAAILTFMVLALAMFLLFKQIRWLYSTLFSLILFLALQTKNVREMDRQQFCMVGNIRGESAIGLIRGRKAVLLLDSGWQANEARVAYALGNFWVTHGVRPIFCEINKAEAQLKDGSTLQGLHYRSGWRGKNSLISFGGLRLIILRDDRFYQYRSSMPLSADLLVVSGGVPVRPDRIHKEFRVGLIILDSSMKSFQASQWKEASESLGLPCYSVTDKGAYLINLEQGMMGH